MRFIHAADIHLDSPLHGHLFLQGDGAFASCGNSHAVRVSITGGSAAHCELFGPEAQLRTEVLAQIGAISHDRLWLEKVRVQTTPVESEKILRVADAIADLQGLLVEAESDPEFLEMLKERLITLNESTYTSIECWSLVSFLSLGIGIETHCVSMPE